MGNENENEKFKSKKCIDLHTFEVIEWAYGEYVDGRFVKTTSGNATHKRARMIACRHCTYIREIQYKD